MRSCANCRPYWRPGPACAPSAAPGSTPTREPRPNEVLLGPVLGIFSEPQDDGGDDQGGAKVGGSFGVAGGQGPELLEAGEAAFDDVASGIDVLVERRWPAARGTFGLAAGGLVGLFRAGEGDSSAAQC